MFSRQSLKPDAFSLVQWEFLVSRVAESGIIRRCGGAASAAFDFLGRMAGGFFNGALRTVASARSEGVAQSENYGKSEPKS